MTYPPLPAQESLNQPLTGFFSLPHELRDNIYTLSLVSDATIIAWTGESQNVYFERQDPKRFYSRKVLDVKQLANHDAISSNVKYLVLGLLCRNRIVGKEAAEVFYGRNT